MDKINQFPFSRRIVTKFLVDLNKPVTGNTNDFIIK